MTEDQVFILINFVLVPFVFVVGIAFWWIVMRGIMKKEKGYGLPGWRDDDAPCLAYDPRERKPEDPGCDTDGHHLCEGCAYYNPFIDDEGNVNLAVSNPENK